MPKSEGLLPEIQLTDLALSAEVDAVWVDQALPSSALFLCRPILLPVAGAESRLACKEISRGSRPSTAFRRLRPVSAQVV